MDEKKILKIKNAVMRNFEQSPDKYSEFETKYGFFYSLNSVLLDRLKIHSNARVLDIGCGTGASSRQILETIPGALVWGLDNSPSMLDVARSNNPDPSRLQFVEGDAGDLMSCVRELMDVIIYSASIFLIPDYEASLSQAWKLLEPGGQLGLTFMVGVFDDSNENAYVRADRDAQTNVSLKKPVEFDSLVLFVRDLFGSIDVETVNFLYDIDLLKQFYSIPAMSAGLYPALAYEERLKMLDELFARLPCGKLSFRWNLITAVK
ncbi:MAG: class I SAM-dependent methyltransferase [Pseudomonadota bacterium]